MDKDKLEVLSHRQHKTEKDPSKLHVHAEDQEKIQKVLNQVNADGEDGSISIIGPNEAAFEAPEEAQKASIKKPRAPERMTAKRKEPAVSRPKPQQPIKPKVTKPETVVKNTPSEKTESDPLKFSPKPLAMSKGVAYLQGNMIRLIGGVRLHPGDQIKIGERELVLRAGKKNKNWIYAAAAATLLMLLVLISPLFRSSHDAVLIGMVTQANTGEIIPDVTVHLKELDQTIHSNDFGFFVFESLPAGSYAMTVASNGHEPKSEKIEITEDQPLTLLVELTPMMREDLTSGTSTETSSSKKSGKKKHSSDETITGSKLGAVKIKSNVSDPTILIDDRLAGVGNKTFRDIEPGKHVMAVTREGYYDWAKEVTIKSGRTITLEVTLSPDKTSYPDAQTWKDFVALGNSQLNANDLSLALGSYNKALDLKPDSPDALLGRGYVYQKMGDRSKAWNDFKKSAEYFEIRGDYRNASISYTNLIALNDRDLDCYLNRGICYLRLSEYQSSISDLTKAAKLDPDVFQVHLYLGDANYHIGEFEHSIDSYKRAKKLNPDNYLVFMGITKAYYAKGDKSKAKKSYKNFEKLSTYLQREKLKENNEWREILKGMEIE